MRAAANNSAGRRRAVAANTSFALIVYVTLSGEETRLRKRKCAPRECERALAKVDKLNTQVFFDARPACVRHLPFSCRSLRG